MLVSLLIKNYALIEHLNENFSDGFTVITGETGAGKSILLGALSLVLGSRADTSSLKDKDVKAVIEAHFNIENYNLSYFFEENELDYEKVTIIRREILPNGKSRAYVNDSPVNLSVVQDLSGYLIDIHSQYDTRSLLDENYQLNFVDTIAQNQIILKEYKEHLAELKSIKNKIKDLEITKENLAKEVNYNSFLFDELENAEIVIGNQKKYEEELEELNNVESIKENLEKVLHIAIDENIGTLYQLKESKNALLKISNLSLNYSNLLQRLDSQVIEYQDVINDVQNFYEKISDNPDRINFLNEKLQILYNLQKKHNAQTEEELISFKNKLSEKLFISQNVDAEIEKLKQKQHENIIKLNSVSDIISNNRKAVISKIEEEILQVIIPLGMPNAKFNIDIQPTKDFTDTGKDKIKFLFSANKGLQVDEIKKVASGGELSRIMLSLKSILAQYTKLPTIIFDEIDTGVSGEISIKMAEILKNISKNLQVFSITHLPQIAAKGKQHLKVYKSEKNNVTTTQIKMLNSEERVLEIAEMLSGKSLSNSAIEHAKTLLH